jgi:hypothetical protein
MAAEQEAIEMNSSYESKVELLKHFEGGDTNSVSME